MVIQISLQDIKELRNRTGAGIIDCKKALQSSQGNMDIAIENLRKKGLAFANKKSNRITAEGVIESYIHMGSKIGVLVELNCETDFVARRPEFQKLAKDIAMQIAAYKSIQYIAVKDISKQTIDNEMRIESQKEDLINKPKEVKEKIVIGRLDKRLKEITLMNQPFIKNQDQSVEELIQYYISLLGENIQVRRFERFILGEGIEKQQINYNQQIIDLINK
uniref:Elongation factor Ts, mitochondrial n=1 Tax=Plocamium cartilagineum TaxID=31452 RepID=A0A1C9CHN7_PLOCA|nr:elongation factor Ts [Plocamium cartilagineum]AOM67877.1 elongation factor Ts [Plocamium cartilagineum]